MSPVRRHFWHVVARVKLGSPRPRNSRLNWFIPAGVNSTVGSLGTSTSLGLRTQPLDAEKSRDASRRFVVVMARRSSVGWWPVNRFGCWGMGQVDVLTEAGRPWQRRIGAEDRT